jgi:predicted RNA-binding Zn-ribbon protein involved in translation (DUF1610 family)
MRFRAGSSDVQSLLTFVFATLLVLAGVGVWFTMERDGKTQGNKPSFQAVQPTNEATEIVCPTCKGKLHIPCTTCQQRIGIYFLDADGKCPTCKDSKISVCDQCKGKGTITLPPQPGVLRWGGKKP